MAGIELIFRRRSGGVATETALDLRRFLAATERIFQALGHGTGMSRSYVERLGYGKETEMAFVQVAIQRVNIGLTHMSDTKGP